eukprot:2738851-Amphidinium_carterae.2
MLPPQPEYTAHCSAYAEKRSRDLARPCPGKITGTKRAQKSRVESGVHPSAKRGDEIMLGRACEDDLWQAGSREQHRHSQDGAVRRHWEF